MAKTNFFIPKKIKVGYVKRDDTYTKQLAYVIYYDERNKLRKEASWQSWRDKSIEPDDFDNTPTEGFVLNKKVGGYSTGWNHRNTYVRVYDPRGFEFEISVPNLLYILENATSTKGKGLEGKFIYGYEGKDLILIPCDSPDYVELEEYNKIVHENNFIKPKDLKIGATYITKQNDELVYMGRFEAFNYRGTSDGIQFWFYNPNTEYGYFMHHKSVAKKFISCANEYCAIDYTDIMDRLETNEYFSPIDRSKDVFVDLPLDKFLENCKEYRGKYYGLDCYSNGNKVDIRSMAYHDSEHKDSPNENVYISAEDIRTNDNRGFYGWNVIHNSRTPQEMYDLLKPQYKITYLANGREYKREGI